MIRNYFKIALRNLLKNKLYALINVFGLAVGLGCCLLISLFVQYEYSYDGFFPDADRIYRVSPNFEDSAMGPARRPAANVAALAPLIERAGIDGVDTVARIGGMHGLIEHDGIVFNEDYLRWADAAFFDIFALDWQQGDRESALAQPGSVVITESLAAKYFGDDNPMGQTLMLENTWPMQVTGVIGDISAHSHLRADLFVSMDTAWDMLDFDYGNNWSFTNFHTYIKLAAGAEIDAVMAQIDAAVTGEDTSLIDKGLAQFFSISNNLFSMTAYPLRDIHLTSNRTGELGEPGNLNNVYLFSAIAVCLLLIACINFMNLSTARSTQRAREVGMRKSLGAGKRELVAQFLGESLFMTFLALVAALALVEMLLPVFGALVERELAFSALANPVFIVFIAGVSLATGLLAGSYPAFFLSSFQPGKVLKYEAVNAGKTLTVRNLLVIFQFFLAITLIVSTLVVALQMRFVRDFNLGFNHDNVIELMGTHQDGLGAAWNVFKDDLQQYPDIIGITEEALFPGSAGNRHVRIEGGPTDGFNIWSKQVGFDFFDTYEIPLVAGRLFDESLITDLFTPPGNQPDGEQPAGAFILNETAVRDLGWTPEQVIGKHFDVDFSADFSFTVSGPVIGVVADFHLFSLREPLQPMVFFVPESTWAGAPTFNIASVRINGDNATRTLGLIRDKWQQYLGEIPFMYEYVDTYWRDAYREEERQGGLFSLFALLTITIACLGLYGLASFTAERRRKEIGVRKVMGSSVLRIVLLLTNDFSKLVLVANLLAWPVAWFAMNRWLDTFTYRIDLTPMIFIASGVIALSIAWVTVGGTAAKAASQRPVLALRYE